MILVRLTRHFMSIVSLILLTISYLVGQRTYISSNNDNYISTNKKYFIIPETPSNQGLNDFQSDFYSNMRLSLLMSTVSKNGNTIEEGNFRISRVKFAIYNTGIFGTFIQNLKMVIVEPLNTGNNSKPVVLATIGGRPTNDSEVSFLTGISQYAMKGYVVAYYENPNINTQDQLLYLINKGVNNNVYPNEGYLASTYLGVQVATAAAKYLSFHSDTYGVNSNEFYLMGQSYGAFMSMNLGLGQTSDYINTDGTLKKPFNKLGDRDRFLNNMMRAATFTIKGISLWSISYPIISNKNYNPYGNLISPNDPRVIHFHGLMDTEVSYKTDWLNFTPDTSLYCAGPTDVREFFSVSQVPFKAFINCKGGHAVFDIGNDELFPKNLVSQYLAEFDFNNISTAAQQNPEIHQKLQYVFEQGTNIIDLTTLFFQNQPFPQDLQNDLYFIQTQNPITDGYYKLSDCMDVGYCTEYNNYINTPCDDQDACTTNDAINSQCKCAGILQDTDNDGTCDALDVCPQGPEPGTPCDDLNLETSNDMIQQDCTCSGISAISDANGKTVIYPNPFSEGFYFKEIDITKCRIIYPVQKDLEIDIVNRYVKIGPFLPSILIIEITDNLGKTHIHKVIIKE